MDEKNADFRGRILSIQWLRAAAMICIALFHIDAIRELLPGIGFGVHLFFVISGFMMMYSTQRGFFPLSFVIKRLIRIVPLYWLMTLLTFAAAQIVPSLSPDSCGFSELIKSMLFIPYAREGFRAEQTIRPLVGPAWALYYEIYSTLIFAVCSHLIGHRNRALGTGLVQLALVLLGASVQWRSPVMRFITSDYFIDITMGMLMFYVLQWMWKYELDKSQRALCLALAFVAVALLLNAAFLVPRIIWYALLSCCLLGGVMLGCKGISLPQKWSWITHLGDISYSFYLLHYYIIIIVGKVIPMRHADAFLFAGTVCVLLGSFIGAEMLYKLVEQGLGGFLKRKLERYC